MAASLGSDSTRALAALLNESNLEKVKDWPWDQFHLDDALYLQPKLFQEQLHREAPSPEVLSWILANQLGRGAAIWLALRLAITSPMFYSNLASFEAIFLAHIFCLDGAAVRIARLRFLSELINRLPAERCLKMANAVLTQHFCNSTEEEDPNNCRTVVRAAQSSGGCLKLLGGALILERYSTVSPNKFIRWLSRFTCDQPPCGHPQHSKLRQSQRGCSGC